MLHSRREKMRAPIIRTLPLTVGIFLTVFCSDALALQTHGGDEGIVVHQLAHIQYLGALGYLLWNIRRSSFAGIGWLYLQRFSWLMMIWNAVAFLGHFAQMALPDEAVSTEDGYLSALLLLPVSLGKWVYYMTALDHLVCVPALFFLFLAMRTFYSTSLDQQSGEET